jgi:hypothetical protein
MGPDYRGVRYDPNAGKRALAVCAIMVIAGFGILASPLGNSLDVGVRLFEHHISLRIIPIGLIFFGIVWVIPAVMKLTPPRRR